MSAVTEARAAHRQLVRATYWLSEEARTIEINPESSPKEKRKPMRKIVRAKRKAKT